MAAHSPVPSPIGGFADRAPRRCHAAAIVCAGLVLSIVTLVLRIASMS